MRHQDHNLLHMSRSQIVLLSTKSLHETFRLKPSRMLSKFEPLQCLFCIYNTNKGIQDVHYILTCPSLAKAATKAGLATLDFETAMQELANALGC